MIPLLKQFPGIAGSLPYISLADLPTPVHPLKGLEKELNRSEIFIKRDDLSGALYGGNKIRKLEFVLAKAISEKAVRVITSGAAGSNHCLAVAMYAAQCGLKTDLMLFAQEKSKAVTENLLADFYCGATIHHDKTYEEHLNSTRSVIEHYTQKDGRAPFIIPPGGSSVEGVAGYVNAAFELRDQISSGELSCPERIFVALGTMGTAAGLALGIKAAGLPCSLTAVRVVPSYVADRNKFFTLLDDTNRLLHDADSSFPICQIDDSDFFIEDGYLGAGYGIVTREAQKGIELMSRVDSIKLDGVYTGKVFAAFLDSVSDESHRGGSLFWNTKNSRALPQEAMKIDYHRLPGEFHKYFQ